MAIPFDERTRAVILDVITRCGHKQTAADAVGISTQRLRDVLSEDTAFAEMYKEAYDRFRDTLEEAARKRAVDGIEKIIYYQGTEVGRERVYSDKLLELMLKGHIPERYQDSLAIEANVKTTGVLVVAPQLVSAAEWEDALEAQVLPALPSGGDAEAPEDDFDES